MWGSWLGLSLTGVIVIALLLGLAVLGSPLLAILIAVVVGGALLVGAALQRSSEHVDDKRVQRDGDVAEITTRHGSRHGAPAGGEGGPPPDRR
jgi:hypothetical protein